MRTPCTPIAFPARLPHGVVVTFKWNGTMAVEWQPASPPIIRSARHRRKFFAAYRRERDTFLQTVAAIIGQIAIIDVEGGRSKVSVIDPPTRN